MMVKLIEIARRYTKKNGIKFVTQKTWYFLLNYLLNKQTIRRVEKSKLKYGLSGKKETQVIVSLTTFPERFLDIKLCLKSLLLQEMKPDKIIVYLGSDTCEADITEDMHEMEKFGIEYKIDPEMNLRPHKKYYYAMQEYPNAIIVTADDDIIYPKNWLKKLIEAQENYPHCICAWRVHKIEFDNDGEIKPYKQWLTQYRGGKPCMNMVATGCGGVVYPPDALDKRAFNAEEIKRLCINADDIWLKCMEVLNDTPVVWVNNFQVGLPEIKKQQGISLKKDNVDGGSNDKYLHAVMEKYHMDAKSFM